MDESQGWVVKGVVSRKHTVLGQTFGQHFWLITGINLTVVSAHTELLLGILSITPGH